MYVYIIGVDHRIQWIPQSHNDLNWVDAIGDFSTYIKEQAAEFRPELIAEEFSQEALNNNPAEESTVRKVASELGLSHLFCDPDSKERHTLGIENDDQEKREMEWLTRLTSSRYKKILFVCGDSHVGSFSTKLIEKGHQVQILSRNWGKGWELI